MRAARVDANQGKIVAVLRNAGVTVQPLHTVGGGVPDLLCAFLGLNFLVEVKDGAKIPSEQKLTPDQVEWHQKWGAPVHIVNSEQAALEVVEYYQRRVREMKREIHD
jgi:hypothetical protein